MLRQLSHIAREAGQIMLSYHDAGVHQKEGHFNFVTDADVAVQRFLAGALQTLLPGARFFAEEQENEPLTDVGSFVVDPVDGPLNYMRWRRASVVSIALLKNRQPVLGVVCNPYARELFSAEANRGAKLNGKEIRVSNEPFERAMVSFGTSPYDSELAQKTLSAAARFLHDAGDLRRTGSAALDLCEVACGRTDVFFELRLRPWDVAAGSLIVREAGGHFVSLGRQAPYYESACGVLATNSRCFEAAMGILKTIL